MGGLDEISMIDVERRHGDTRLAEDEAGTDVMSFDLNALDRIHLVRETDSPIFGEGVPQIGHHLFRPRRAVNHERRLPAAERGLDPAAHPQIGQPVDVVRVEVGQKMGVDGAQRNLLLPETNRRPPPEVEDEPQPRDFHQRAVSVAIHRRDRASGAEQRDGHGSAASAVPADLTVATATVRPGRRAAGARAPRRAAAGARAPRRAAAGAARAPPPPVPDVPPWPACPPLVPPQTAGPRSLLLQVPSSSKQPTAISQRFDPAKVVIGSPPLPSQQTVRHFRSP